MNKLSKETLEELVRQKLDGESYTVIRERLSEMGLSKEEISHTIREMDERVLRTEVELSRRRRAKSWYRTGLVIAVAGLLLSVGYNAGMILENALNCLSFVKII